MGPVKTELAVEVRPAIEARHAAIALGELGSWLPKIADALRERLTARGLPGWVEPGAYGLGRQPAVYGLVDSLGGLAFA